MKTLIATLAGTVLLAASAVAQDAGDAAKGEKSFNKCKACHSITDADGKDIVKGGKVGPNLYAIAGRKAGSVEGFKYSEYLVAAGEAGLMWNPEDFAAYVADPTAFLKAKTGDTKAKGKMSFKLPKAEEAADIWAYLHSVGPQG